MKKSFKILFFLLFTIIFTVSLKGQDVFKRWIGLINGADSIQLSSLIYSIPDNYPCSENELDTTLKYIRSDNPSVRKAITILLGESGKFPLRVIPELVMLMQDKNEGVRQHAIVALSKYDSIAVIPLLNLLGKTDIIIDPTRRVGKDGQTNVRLSDLAIIGLIHIKSGLVRPLFKAYGDDDNFSNILKYILAKNKYITTEELIPYLKSSNKRVKMLTLSLLGYQGLDAEYAIPFVANLLNNNDSRIVNETLTTLCKLGPMSLPILSAELKANKNNAQNRLTIISNLWYIGEASLPTLVQTVSEDNDSEVRIKAAYEIPEVLRYSNIENFDSVYFDSACEILSKTLLDKNVDVATESAYALSFFTENRTPNNKNIIVPYLIKALRSQIEDVQNVAAELMATIKDLGQLKEAAIKELLGGLSQPPLYNISTTHSWEDPRKQFIKSIGIINSQSSEIIQIFDNILTTDTLKYLYPFVFEAAGNFSELSHPLVPVMVKKLPLIDIYSRKSAMTALSKIYPDGLDSLMGIVKSKNYNDSFKIIAIQVLGTSSYEKETINKFLEAIVDDKHADKNIHVAASESRFLLGFKDSQAKANIKQALEENIDISRILEILKTKEKGDLPFILELWNDYKIADRSLILEILSKMYPNTLTDEILIKALSDNDKEVRSKSLALINDLSRDALTNLIKIYGLLDSLKKLIVSEISINENLDIRRWLSFQRFKSSYDEPVIFYAFNLVNTLGPLAGSILPTLDSFLNHPNPTIRLMVIQVIGTMGIDTLNLSRKIYILLSDKVDQLKIAAAKTLVQLHVDIGELDSKYTSIVIDNFIRRDFQYNYLEIADFLRPSDLVSGISPGPLPPFPWPPPEYSNISKFGVDMPMQLIGVDTTHLYNVYLKLVKDLKRIDPNFEEGLFGVPGGFALLTKIERIYEDGKPLPGKYRWVTGKIPPLSFTDYLGQLFYERPGYFREVAFIFTDENNFGHSNKSLPDIHTGGTDFPPDLVNKPLKSVNGYILIYSFKRVNGGKLTNYNQLSALVQLSNSGIYQSLSQ